MTSTVKQKTPVTKFVEEDWQHHDIIRLLMKHDAQAIANTDGKIPKQGAINHMTGDKMVSAGTANWSEMGCYKTSTGLWYIDAKLKEAQLDHPPSILIVTNKSGKG